MQIKDEGKKTDSKVTYEMYLSLNFVLSQTSKYDCFVSFPTDIIWDTEIFQGLLLMGVLKFYLGAKMVILFKVVDLMKVLKLHSISHWFSIYFQYASVFVEVLIPFKLKNDYSTVEGSIWTWLILQALAVTNFHQYGSLQLNQTSLYHREL